MIDISTETVLTLSAAAKSLPERRRGSSPHVATLYRWAQRGVKDVRLETIQIGGTLCTSTEALQRFFDALSEPRTPATNKRPDRHRAIAAAERDCERAGI